MITKTSQQLKAEPTTNFYGINAASLIVEKVGLTRGGTLTHWPADKSPRSYRIRGGRPARDEVERVFRLTDVIGINFRADAAPGEADHPLLAALQRMAAGRRNARANRLTIELASARARAAITHDRAQYPDHRVLSEHEHGIVARPPQEGTHPLAGLAVAAAGWSRADDPDGETS